MFKGAELSTVIQDCLNLKRLLVFLRGKPNRSSILQMKFPFCYIRKKLCTLSGSISIWLRTRILFFFLFQFDNTEIQLQFHSNALKFAHKYRTHFIALCSIQPHLHKPTLHEPRFFLIPGFHLSRPVAYETSSYTLFHLSGLAFSDISTLFPF